MLRVVEITKKFLFDDEQNGKDLVSLNYLANGTLDEESKVFNELDLMNRDLLKNNWTVILDGQKLNAK